VTTCTTVGLDIAKSSFQVHGIAASGGPTLGGKLRRGKVLEFFANLPACLIGMEACGGAHHWPPRQRSGAAATSPASANLRTRARHR
jgi:transposase